MRLEHPIPHPAVLPSVPPRLAQRLAAYLDRTLRIEILVHVAGRQWEKVNILHLDDEPTRTDDGPLDPAMVGAWVKACADAHAVAVGRDGKYRALLVRHIGERDHRMATFRVEWHAEAEQRQRTGIRWSTSKNPWVNLTIAQQAHMRSVAEYSERAVERVLEQRRIREEQDEAVLRTILSELAAVCAEGLRMQTDTARALVEERMRDHLATVQAQVDARIWETLAPVLELAVSAFGQRLQQVRGAEEEPTAFAYGSDTQNTEGAPPSSGDAPSPGKVPSGA